MAYDFTEVVRQLMDNQVPERALLLKKFAEEMEYNVALKHLMLRLMELALQKQMGPSELMEIAFRHGMLVGVLLERELKARSIN